MVAFPFCPDRLVPETIPPEPVRGTSFNGWTFSSKPKVPYRKKFKVTLYGIRWYLDGAGLYDSTTNPNFNARALELFYEAHQLWNTFTFTHPHIGVLTCKFDAPVTVPAALPNSDGRCDPIEILLYHDNPGFS